MLVCGCDNSFGPARPSARALAHHFDSLMVQAESLHTDNGDERALILWNLEVAPALNATPVAVTVTTASGPKTWQGFSWKSTDAFVSIYDSTFTIAAYADAAVTQGLFAQAIYFDGYLTVTLDVVTGDTVAVSDSYRSGEEVQVRSTGGSCTVIQGLSYPFSAYMGDCESATFEGSLSLTLPITSGPLADFQTITIAPQQFNGVWVRGPGRS